MNPLKSLLESFDRLINERGSSNILRERLDFASDQFSVLEQQFAALQIENQNFKKENERLNLDNENLKKKIRDHDEGGSSFASGVIIT